MPIKRQRTIKEKVTDFFSGNSTSTVSPTSAQNKVQNRIDAMKNTLLSIDFEEGAISKEDVTELGLEQTRDAIVVYLQDVNITRDDMSAIDDILTFACDALKDAVENNRPDEAEWAGNALCYGLLNLRKDIPDSKVPDEAARIKMLNERAEWFENYRTIIEAYAEFDDMSYDINAAKAEKDRHVEEFKTLYAAFDNSLKTQEGAAAWRSLIDNADDPAVIARDEYGEMEMMGKIDTLKGLLLTIFSANAGLYAHSSKLTVLNKKIDLLRQTLQHPVHDSDPKLNAKIAKALQDMTEALMRDLHQAKVQQDELQEYQNNIEAAMKSNDARAIASETVRAGKELEKMNEKQDRIKEKADADIQARIEKERQREEAVRVRLDRLPNE